MVLLSERSKKMPPSGIPGGPMWYSLAKKKHIWPGHGAESSEGDLVIMRYAVKLQGKRVRAWELGAGSSAETEMIRAGKIRRNGESYELFSREAVNGQGQKARKGDYFKLDGDGYPYPNAREWFHANHRPIQGDEYEQMPKPLAIWGVEDGDSELIHWLTDGGRLSIREDDEAKYFNARLWGADLSAGKDATVVFYSVDRDENGGISDISFNFVAREEFERTYTVCGEGGVV